MSQSRQHSQKRTQPDHESASDSEYEDEGEDEEEDEETEDAVMQDAADLEDHEIADKLTVVPGEVKKAKEKREREAKRKAKKRRTEGGAAKPERKPRQPKPAKPTLNPGDLDHLNAVAAVSADEASRKALTVGKARAFARVATFSASLGDVNYSTDMSGTRLNTRFIDKKKLRQMLPLFDVSKFTFGFVALRSLDEEAEQWLSAITGEFKHKTRLEALFSVLRTKTELRLVAALSDPRLKPAMDVLKYVEPVGPVNSLQDLVSKGLLPAAADGKPIGLPSGLFLETFAGQHSAEAGRMFEGGIDWNIDRNPDLDPNIKVPEDVLQERLKALGPLGASRECFLFVYNEGEDAFLRELANIENAAREEFSKDAGQPLLDTLDAMKRQHDQKIIFLKKEVLAEHKRRQALNPPEAVLTAPPGHPGSREWTIDDPLPEWDKTLTFFIDDELAVYKSQTYEERLTWHDKLLVHKFRNEAARLIGIELVEGDKKQKVVPELGPEKEAELRAQMMASTGFAGPPKRPMFKWLQYETAKVVQHPVTRASVQSGAQPVYMRWVHKAPNETFYLLLRFLRAYQDNVLPDFAEPPKDGVVTKPVASLNSLKTFLFLDFAMCHKPLAGLFDGTTAQRAEDLMRAVGDAKGGRKIPKTKKKKNEAEATAMDPWTPYLPPAPGQTRSRLPNNMLLRYLTHYIRT